MPRTTRTPRHSIAERFGRAIRRLRKEMTGLSQDRFSGKAQIDRSYYSLLERGGTNPSVEVLDRIVRTLGTDYATLGAAVDAER
jgi:transcriptional regulator with XRE-family HTH domain